MNLSQNIANTVIKTNFSAHQLWLNIEKLFRDNKDSHVMQLYSEIRTICMGDLPVQAYCMKIQKIANLLENLDPSSKIYDKHLVMYTVNGLSPRFENIARVLLHCIMFPNFSETRSILALEESCFLQLRAPTVPAHSTHPSSLLFYTQHQETILAGPTTGMAVVNSQETADSSTTANRSSLTRPRIMQLPFFHCSRQPNLMVVYSFLYQPKFDGPTGVTIKLGPIECNVPNMGF